MDWIDVDAADAREVNEPEATTPTHEHKVLRTLVVLVLVLAVGAVGFTLGHYVDTPSATVVASPRTNFPNFPSGGNEGSEPPGSGPRSPQLVPPTSTGSKAAATVAKKVDPGLVDITTSYSQGSTAEGTGMIISSNGLVLTNNHVIAGASSITARDIATNTTYQAKVLGYDVSADVALIQLKNASGLQKVTTGDSTSLVVGEKIVGIGNAGGVGATPTFSAGKVVALNQSITAGDESSPAGAEQLSGLIEVNAPILPGDSGGPLVNAKGRVVGIDTAGSASFGGFGFEQTGLSTSQAYAIPINTALAIAKSIESASATSGVHIGTTAFLGVEIGSASRFGGVSSPSTASGVVIDQVVAGASAQSAGLVAGDVITSLDGQSVTNGTALQQFLLTQHPGEVVKVGYLTTNATPATLSVTLGSGPAQ